LAQTRRKTGYLNSAQNIVTSSSNIPVNNGYDNLFTIQWWIHENI